MAFATTAVAAANEVQSDGSAVVVEPRLPSTRYQGSKAKLLPWLGGVLGGLQFDSALDLFSGTASVSFLLKTLGKRVHANDALHANAHVARAIVQNQSTRLDVAEARKLFEKNDRLAYGDFVTRTFRGVFFLDAENAWLDVVGKNIAALPDTSEKSLAYFALFQACLKKRPFNLFHRRNLSLRTAEVSRSFGNKKTWDAPFAAHFEKALGEANRAVFDSGREIIVTSGDALTLDASSDLVYIDPPYMNHRGDAIDYLDFYHFLEGLTELEAWPDRIAHDRPHLPYRRRPTPFGDRRTIGEAFASLFRRHAHSTIVVSYRSDGTPSATELSAMLQAVGKTVTVHQAHQQYALSTRRTHELLLVAR